MRKRLVFRSDDVGYSEAFDLGAYRAFEEGIATSADVMFDAPHAEKALKWLAERPWISVGWHRHLWESPLLGKEVPSMIDEEGRFKWRHRKGYLMNEVTYDDAYREFMAEAELCRSILGHYPDSCYYRMDENVNELERAFRDVIIELGIPANFWYDSPANPGDPKYDYLHFRRWKGEYFVVGPREDLKLEHFGEYDPYSALSTVKWDNDDQIWRIGADCGYCDLHILQESSYNIHRIRDLEACIRLKDWVIENKIELINFRDALNGTDEFQQHLKQIDSPLWIGNM